MAMGSELAEEPYISPVWCKEREKGEVPWSICPGWMEVLHPIQPVTPTGWTPLTLGELRWWCHSQSVGRRRAWQWWAEECKWAMQEKSDSMSSPGSPQVWTKDCTAPRFQGGCSLCAEGFIIFGSHWGSPRNKAARYIDRTHSGNDVHYLHSSGWSHQGYIHGYSDCFSGEGGPWESLHCGQLPRWNDLIYILRA